MGAAKYKVIAIFWGSFDLGVTRFVVSAQEGGGTSFDEMRRFLSDYREQILDRL